MKQEHLPRDGTFRRVDGSGNVSCKAYDAFDHLATMATPATTGDGQCHRQPPSLRSTFHRTSLPDGLGRDGRPLPSAGVISQYDYAYDAAGRRIACARSGDAMSVTDTIAYAYNARGELTNALSSVDANYAYSYQYDDIGNRISSAECGARSAEYVANELNQYTQIDTSTSALSCETFNPEFDDDGNQTLIRTATGEWCVTYNGENRPVLWTCLSATDTIVTNGDTIVMSYDRQGRRVTKNAERFVYDGYLCVKKIEASTPIHYSLLPLHCYVWDPTEPVATRPLVWNFPTLNSQPSTRFYAHDGNKNVSEVIAADDSLAAHCDYAPFGSVIAQRGTFAANPWRFSSEFSDDELGCDCFNCREYEPKASKWNVRDPTGEFLAKNRYFFCINNPIVFFDYLGLSPIWAGGAIDATAKNWLINIGSEMRNRLEEPSAFAQFGPNAHDFQMVKYFKKRYSRLLGYAQQRFTNAINRRIDCESDVVDANSGDASPLAYIAGSVIWPWEDCEFGDDYGDGPQNWWERMASLGNFSIDIGRPVKINYHGECVDGRREYDWTTDVKVIDDLGLDSGNGWLYRWFGGIALPRTVILAKWTLTGRGHCKCCEDR